MSVPVAIPSGSYEFKSSRQEVDQMVRDRGRQNRRSLAMNRSSLKKFAAFLAKSGLNVKQDEEYDFVQCEAGYNHTLLLNAIGQVFSFGQNVQGQLGLGSHKLQQNHPVEVRLPDLLEKDEDGIKQRVTCYATRIRAGGRDSACFDDKNDQMFTWGSFADMHVEPDGKKKPVSSPQPFNLQVVRDDLKHLYALKKDPQGPPPGHVEELKAPGSKGALVHLDVIKTVQAIDWATNHCVFVDNNGRVFSIGQHLNGKTGLAKTLASKPQ